MHSSLLANVCPRNLAEMQTFDGFRQSVDLSVSKLKTERRDAGKRRGAKGCKGHGIVPLYSTVPSSPPTQSSSSQEMEERDAERKISEAKASGDFSRITAGSLDEIIGPLMSDFFMGDISPNLNSFIGLYLNWFDSKQVKSKVSPTVFNPPLIK